MDNNSSGVPSPKPAIDPSALRRRRLHLVIVALVLLVPPYVFRKRLKVENVQKIQLGMTQSEVEKLLGGPPGLHGLHGDAIPMFVFPAPPPGATCPFWIGEEVKIDVCFIDDKVCSVPPIRTISAPLNDKIIFWTLCPIKFW